jgi:hypothetical protein
MTSAADYRMFGHDNNASANTRFYEAVARLSSAQSTPC